VPVLQSWLAIAGLWYFPEAGFEKEKEKKKERRRKKRKKKSYTSLLAIISALERLDCRLHSYFANMRGRSAEIR
jgi:hypothetical protein